MGNKNFAGLAAIGAQGVTGVSEEVFLEVDDVVCSDSKTTITAISNIGNGNFDISAGFDFVVFDVVVVQYDIFSGEIKISAIEHRLPGIDIKVQQNLLDLASIHFYRPDRIARVGFYMDLLFGPGK